MGGASAESGVRESRERRMAGGRENRKEQGGEEGCEKCGVEEGK